MKTRDALQTLSANLIDHITGKRQGRNELRSLLGVGGLYGRAVNAQDERNAAAALQGLRDGWLALDSQAEFYTGEELAWYLAAQKAGAAALTENTASWQGMAA